MKNKATENGEIRSRRIRHGLTQRGFASLSRNEKVRLAKKSHNTLIIKRLCSVTAKNTHKKQEDEGL